MQTFTGARNHLPHCDMLYLGAPAPPRDIIVLLIVVLHHLLRCRAFGAFFGTWTRDAAATAGSRHRRFSLPPTFCLYRFLRAYTTAVALLVPAHLLPHLLLLPFCARLPPFRCLPHCSRLPALRYASTYTRYSVRFRLPFSPSVGYSVVACGFYDV